MKNTTTILFLLSAQALALGAADVIWSNGGQASWTTESNWDSAVPTLGDTVIIDNGGTAIVQEGDKAIGNAITIGKDNEGHVIVENGGQLGVAMQPIWVGANAGSKGSLTVNEGGVVEAGSLHVGSDGEGLLWINGGKVTTSVWNTLTVGTASGSGKIIIDNDGVLQSATDIRIGVSGTGELILNSGLVQTGWQIHIGEGASGNGTVIINGGILQTGSYEGGHGGSQPGDIFVGRGGNGTLLVNNDGIARSTGWTFIGGDQNQGTAGTGIATIKDNGRLETAKQLYVGLDGTGTLNLEGSAVAETQDNVRIGVYSKGNGTVNVGGSSTMDNKKSLYIGETGTGTLTVVDDGKVLVGTSAFIGYNANSQGTLNVDGGSLEVKNNLYVGYNGEADFTQTAGLISVQGGGVRVAHGASSIGTLNLDGGVLEAAVISKGDGAGYINFNGGTLRARGDSDDFISGFSQIGVGANGATIDSNGHSVTINTAFSGEGALHKVGAGTLTLNAHSSLSSVRVEAGTLALAAGKNLSVEEIFVGSGGTLQLKSDAENGGSFATAQTLVLENASQISLDPSTSMLHAETLDLTNLVADGGTVEIYLTDFAGLAEGESMVVFTFDQLADGGAFVQADDYFHLANGDGSEYMFQWSADGKALELVNVAAVPEPSTYAALGGVGFLALVIGRRIRRKQQIS